MREKAQNGNERHLGVIIPKGVDKLKFTHTRRVVSILKILHI